MPGTGAGNEWKAMSAAIVNVDGNSGLDGLLHRVLMEAVLRQAELDICVGSVIVVPSVDQSIGGG